MCFGMGCTISQARISSEHWFSGLRYVNVLFGVGPNGCCEPTIGADAWPSRVSSIVLDGGLRSAIPSLFFLASHHVQCHRVADGRIFRPSVGQYAT